MELPDWVNENKKELVIGTLGICLMGYGFWKSYSDKVAKDSLVSVDPVELNTTMEKQKIMVDVSGAVQKPGLYALTSDARINDALVLAGGLASSADRGYVGRYINLAERLVDGMKIYIPLKDDPIPSQSETLIEQKQKTQGVSVNSSSASEMEALWGIGEARAKQIIENRPYSSIDELITKAAIPSSVIERNKNLLHL